MSKTSEESVGSTVYVVDDSDAMRRALEMLLGTVGYQTALFSGPSEFLRQFNSDAPGCLVLDIRMPEMSGLELQQQLNRLGAMIRSSSLPVTRTSPWPFRR